MAFIPEDFVLICSRIRLNGLGVHKRPEEVGRGGAEALLKLILVPGHWASPKSDTHCWPFHDFMSLKRLGLRPSHIK